MSKLTAVLTDTWRGMVERRLWPVALLLLAGLVAVPLLLTADPEPVPPVAAAPAEEAAELAAQPLVAVASAAERERARRVLGARKDPFKPTNQPKRRKARAGESAGDKSSAKAASTSRTGSSDSSSAPGSGAGGAYVAPAPLPAATAPGTAEKSPARPAGSLRVRWGTAGDEELEALHVERLDPLPTSDEPLLVYLGLTRDGRSAVFMLDAGVTVVGDGRCRPDPADCQTIELERGETAFLEVAGDDGAKTQYQLDLVKIHGRRAARTPTKHAASEARATRHALRSLSRSAPPYRFDARTGTLAPIEAQE